MIGVLVSRVISHVLNVGAWAKSLVVKAVSDMEISKANERKLSAARLRTLLDCNPVAGTFTWKIAPNGRVKVGSPAGTLHHSGYVCIAVNKVGYLRHRLVWLFVHGEWPKGQLDHDNGVRGDDRLENLRLATPSENITNAKRRRDNTSGFKGVSKLRHGWEARIMKNGKQTWLGFYETPEAAHEAYKQAALKFHGEFARFA